MSNEQAVERDWLVADAKLTEAEWEVVDAIAHGWCVAKISEWLGINLSTVRVHVSNIAHKLPPHAGLKGYARILYWLMKCPVSTEKAA